MRLYLCSIEELADAASFDAASLKVDQVRKESLKRLKNPADLRRSVGAGILLAYAFWQYRSHPQEFRSGGEDFFRQNRGGAFLEEPSWQELLSVPDQDLDYRKTPSGKPYLEGAKDFFFSLSHSGSFVLCACASAALGADIQIMREQPKETLAARIMTQEEYDIYKKLPEKEKKREFYRIWACKESCCKLTGRGLAQDFRGMQTDWSKNAISLREEDGAVCCRSFIWKDDYWIAVSCMGEA